MKAKERQVVYSESMLDEFIEDKEGFKGTDKKNVS